ncbi:hypothetical protein MEN41_17790 [Dolichospermum sp. ST_con]|nr:hypothetical protein [Dolichospermum sp. ST_con]MDD1417925.1 hypothetical protein [Dolichospermum sp. ST_sed1]MDD1427861.1 hypothetical protein [Dolichospermum sp. ST_sed9]MDD1429657.1 hypothetical protein [Dolichospermum sp. ST_sed6]MDD1435916.1 hypothetical protein [Dolichospermum sp. ST_sed10]MDD1439312.1 hypothetical protein [Dolichospermum sp. ST_sed3]MDD1445094.1 hypothetical protein [Dolichospermum sp. ST_sed8]MDD1455478.1 hypothetical protein [Dolichospermum sp. ST_sed7]MDD145929
MLKQSLLKLLILPSFLIPWLSIEILLNSPVKALPGDSTEEVTSWIQAHPTLQPRQGERLFISKSDTAAQRFTFQASVLPPGRIIFTKDHATIRTEGMTMFDAVNGITLQRLEESLRVIYSLDVYQDYNDAQIVYQYPNQSNISTSRLAKTPIREALQGELRLGDRYAYWVEIAKPSGKKAIVGNITVLLKADLGKLETELRTR